MTGHTTSEQIASALKAVASRDKVTEIYFVACGGSFANMLPNQYIIEREAETLYGSALNSAEFKSRAPKRLGKSSIVILCSHSGNTPETVEAAKIARQAGALTISLTHVPGSPLDKESEYTILYVHEPLAMTPEHSASVLARLTFGVLKVREGNNKADELESALVSLESLVEKQVASKSAEIKQFAEAHKFEPAIYTMASGSNFGVAYSYAICIYQEMQWIHSAAIHAGEYFHGPFEITDHNVPFIQLLGAGNTRDMDIRGSNFVNKFSDRVTTLDANELGASQFSDSIAEYLTPMIFSPVLRAYAERLAEAKGHPLTVRRYMWKMDY